MSVFGLKLCNNYAPTCSTTYWILSLLQLPITVGASAYEAVCLYRGSRATLSTGEAVITWKVHQLILYCCCGILAGIVGGLLGLCC
ncbi:sulfite exporter TauE/SafE family protein 3-like isoform X2 [Lycium barbarum]|uniref:sulfite exporter TauE/SafE family protein 3-like isoform X2 n=1 Tax=Lycium barbarum TaxID=112863 RepID=UPI00293E7FC4|nr:sulfite exporter TauE/SafE family protein 3-like isoform X2 [Lycium barbarum]